MKPLILEYAIDRIGEIETIYDYDFTESLNVISINNQKKAIIDSSSHDLSMITKTKVNVESDDFDINMLELQTRTRVYQESDDEYNQIVGLNIKTYIKQERDDESFNNIT